MRMVWVGLSNIASSAWPATPQSELPTSIFEQVEVREEGGLV